MQDRGISSCIRLTTRRVMLALAVTLSLVAARRVIAQAEPVTRATVPAYRARILGVFNAQSGEAIEGAEVVDLVEHVTARTTKTGTVSLAFLPEGGSLVRIQKVGYHPVTQVIPISPADTVPITVVLTSLSQELPLVITTDSAPRHRSPGLREFEERRKSGMGGRFLGETDLRNNDNRVLSNVIRGMGVKVECSVMPTRCYATSMRSVGLSRRPCPFDVYVDGMRQTRDERDLDKLRVDQFAGVEAYMGAATIPTMYNMTGSACGVLLFWSRER